MQTKSILALFLIAMLSISVISTKYSFFDKQERFDKSYFENIKSQDLPFETFSYEDSPFKDWTLDEVKSLLGTKDLFTQSTMPSVYGDEEPIDYSEYINEESNEDPTKLDNFDSRDKWRNCIGDVRFQGNCGSCWAFALTSTLADRFCIAYSGRINLELSPQDLVNCDYYNHACNGGSIFLSWMYVHTSGVVRDSCIPYSSSTGYPGRCRDTCINQAYYKKYFSKSRRPTILRTIDDIKREIYYKGPIETGYIVYDDFMNYRDGVYVHRTGRNLGGHAVEVVGWGTDKTTRKQYWIAKNSWGTRWGKEGYFNFEMGQCDFEANAMVGDPDLYR